MVCDIFCSICSGIFNNCNSCVNGYFKKNSICVDDCGFGFYFDGLCKVCNLICEICEGIVDNCKLCKFFWFKKGFSCVISCFFDYNLFFKLFVWIVFNGVGQIFFEGCVEVSLSFVYIIKG